jgi:menaquinone-dependent protoporphyrinogen oxidase
MSNPVLVAYATRYGSTQEVADKIAATLRQSGLTVEVHPAKQVRTLDGYRAVVLGAPLYMSDWLKEARNFLSRHRATLTTLPVAIFALGPTEDKEKDWTETRKQFDKVLSQFPWLTPVAAELFGGRFDPSRLTFPYNLIPGLKRMSVSDIRDWDAIGVWANGLVEKLG